MPPRFVRFPSTDGEAELVAAGVRVHAARSKVTSQKLQVTRCGRTSYKRNQVELHAALYEPDTATFGAGPHPTVVSCYGGPHVQWVQNSWARMTADVSAQLYRAQGYLVVKVDNRGADRRGLAFEAAILGRLGCLEVDDQVAAVKHAVGQGLADPKRVGIMGWSYGGYLSAMCLAKAPEVFRCAVAGAPVTSWDGYDTHCMLPARTPRMQHGLGGVQDTSSAHSLLVLSCSPARCADTERYCDGTPTSNPAAYDDSSVMSHVDRIEGALLLVHGLMDENVHFRHTARLTQALVEGQKRYEMLCFPNERHSPRAIKDRIYMEEQISSFMRRWLMD